jgi:hypothetical protein
MACPECAKRLGLAQSAHGLAAKGARFTRHSSGRSARSSARVCAKKRSNRSSHSSNGAGNSSNGAGRGKRGSGKGSGQKQPKQQGRRSGGGAAVTETYVTKPPRIAHAKVLQASAQALEPWWSTFCGHTEGVWCGKFASFALNDAELEPLTMMKKGKEVVYEMHSRVTEQVRHSHTRTCLGSPVRTLRWERLPLQECSSSLCAADFSTLIIS